MLIKQPQVEIVSKIVRNSAGETVCAYFACITIEGHTEVKFLGAKPIEASEAGFEAQATPVALLESPYAAVFNDTPVRQVESVSTPFYTIDLFFSQLARAPSLA